MEIVKSSGETFTICSGALSVIFKAAYYHGNPESDVHYFTLEGSPNTRLSAQAIQLLDEAGVPVLDPGYQHKEISNEERIRIGFSLKRKGFDEVLVMSEKGKQEHMEKLGYS